MHLRSASDAQIMRRAATGPHALMLRRAFQPYVPDRGSTLGFYMPSRRQRRLGALGALGGSTVQGAAQGASIGASVGSAVPLVGTAVGAILGGIGGAIASAFNRQDQEVQNFDQAIAISRANPMGVLDIQNKYLVLAGLFDLDPKMIKGNIPMYKKYGRMGEERFVDDMIQTVYNAAQSGQITANDTAQSVFSRVVQPWMNSFGYGPMSDSNADMINLILMGMLSEYFAGLQSRWYARGGDYPASFRQLPMFSLPSAGGQVQNTPTASPTPSPVPSQFPAASAGVPAEVTKYQSGALPPVGGGISFALDNSTGQFLQLPSQGAVFEGRTPRGDWIIQYPFGTFILQNGQLMPYSSAAPLVTAQPAPVPSSPVTSPQTVGSQTSTPVPTPQTIFVPSGGGGGGFVSAPVSTAQSIVPATTGMTLPMELLIGGGVLALVLLLKKGKRL